MLTVVSRVKPGSFYQAGARVLMLGAIVEQPATRLAGYQGGETRVIMGGYPIVLPSDRPS